MPGVDISIIVPTHQRGALLERVLSSLREQTLPKDRYEVIVIVDGSTDGTYEMVQRMAPGWNLRAVYQDQSGPSAARNHGARLATGSVLLFLDDDMLSVPGLLERHLAVHESDSSAVVLGQYLPAEDSNARGQGGWNAWEARVLQSHYEAMVQRRRPPAGRRLYSGNFSVRRTLFESVGGFNEHLKRGEDVELGLRLEDAGGTFHFAPEAGSVHCGFRSFESWARSSYLYGRCDVQLTQDQGRGTLDLVLSWYAHQRPTVRTILEVGLFHPLAHRLLVQSLHRVGGGLVAGGIRNAGLDAYGAIYKLQYWKGVMDQLGGRRAFKAHLRNWRDRGFAAPTSTTRAL